MDNTRCVLATIKIVQLGMGIGCLALRESAHMNPDLPEVHNTLFCGTFMGFTIIAVALLLGYCIRKPAPKEVDLFFGFVGGVCFYLCGTLSMHYPTIDEKMMILPAEEQANYPFFRLCSNIALACFANALLYMFEACVLYDIWWYERQRQERRSQQLAALTADMLRDGPGRAPSLPEEEDESEGELPDGQLGRLRLHCYCLEVAWTRLCAAWRQHREASRPPTQPGTAAPSAATLFRFRSAGRSQPQPQAGPSSAPDSHLPRRQSFSGFEQTRIRITPPDEDEEDDSDATGQ